MKWINSPVWFILWACAASVLAYTLLRTHPDNTSQQWLDSLQASNRALKQQGIAYHDSLINERLIASKFQDSEQASKQKLPKVHIVYVEKIKNLNALSDTATIAIWSRITE